MKKYLRNLNAAKIWAAIIAIGTAVANPEPEIIGVAVSTVLAAVAGDKNPAPAKDAPESREDAR